MKLSEAKRLIEAANDGNGGYTEIDASLPHDEDWNPLGEDHFVSPDGVMVAGPSGGDGTRTCTNVDLDNDINDLLDGMARRLFLERFEFCLDRFSSWPQDVKDGLRSIGEMGIGEARRDWHECLKMLDAVFDGEPPWED